MARIRNIYQVQNLYIGPAPATGYTFVSNLGIFNDDYSNFTEGITSNNYNLVFPINRVQTASWSVNTNKTNILELGKRGTVKQAFIEPITVDLTFDYISMGVVNEHHMGFYTNYTIPAGANVGQALYTDNYSVCSIQGFVTRDLTPGENEIHYPQSYRDKRNLFVLVGAEGQDVNTSSYKFAHPKAQTSYTIGFGNAYITDYRARAAIGEFPTCSVTYLAENFKVYSSGSGCLVPALESKGRSGILDKHFNLPSSYQNETTSALLPGDITINITAYPEVTGILVVYGTGYTGIAYPDLYDLGFKYSDIKIQSYDIDLPLNREPLSALGYKLPIDRQITFPVFTDLGFSFIVGDLQTGSVENLTNKNLDYNIVIKLKNPTNAASNSQKVAVQYDFKGAKFESINYTNQIGGQETASLLYKTEIDPDNLTKGFFISGLLNVSGIQTLQGFILKEDGFALLQENGDKLYSTNFAIF